MNPNTSLAIVQPLELVRQSTDIAGICKEIVLKSAMEIQKRKYVKVEGWQSIATAHGCIASSRDVEKTEDGYKAIGEVRRMSDGGLIAQAEGFVGIDEPTWFGGETEVWDREARRKVKKTLPPRPMYAIRAMAQTRAISRACRSAFAHIVVLMDAGLSTTPAEEVPQGGFDNEGSYHEEREAQSEAAATIKGWRDTICHVGKKMNGKPLSKADTGTLAALRDYLKENLETKQDRALLAAVEMGLLELAPAPGTKSAHAKDEIPVYLQNLKDRLEWASHTTEAFLHVGALSGWTKAVQWSAVTEDDAKGALDSFEDVILPALDQFKAKEAK